jgi:hypothetical protein
MKLNLDALQKKAARKPSEPWGTVHRPPGSSGLFLLGGFATSARSLLNAIRQNRMNDLLSSHLWQIRRREMLTVEIPGLGRYKGTGAVVIPCDFKGKPTTGAPDLRGLETSRTFVSPDQISPFDGAPPLTHNLLLVGPDPKPKGKKRPALIGVRVDPVLLYLCILAVGADKADPALLSSIVVSEPDDTDHRHVGVRGPGGLAILAPLR